MPTITCTFSNPTYNYTAGGKQATDIPVASFVKTHAFDSVSRATLIIRSDVAAIYDIETDDTNNALQLGSTVTVVEGSAYHFRGFVKSKPLFKSYEEGSYLQVECEGPDGVLLQSLCVDSSGHDVWSMETSKVAVANVPLQICNVYGSYQGSTLWPDPDDATGLKCYVDGESDTLDVAIGDGTYAITAVNQGLKTFSVADNVPDEFVADDKFTISGSTGNDGTYTVASATWTGAVTNIVVDEVVPDATADGNILQKILILSTTTKGFVPRGWVKIGNEWIYYNGYDNAAADTKYRLYNCERGQLGTSAAAHVASTVQEKLGKQIAPATMRIDNDPAGGTAWAPLRRGSTYEVLTNLGAFILPAPAVGTYRGSYSVYDEDASLDAGSTAVTLNDIVTALMTGPLAYGGPGFAAGDLDLAAATGLIKVNRYDYDPQEQPIYVYDAIQDLLQQLSLEDEIKFWYKQSTGKFRLTVLANSASSFTLPAIARIEKAMSIEDVYSAVRVEYTDDQQLNRATETYSYHQEATGLTTSPDEYVISTAGGESWDYGTHTHETAAGSTGMGAACDGKPGSKVTAVYNHDPGTPVEHSVWWFGAGTTPPMISLDRIKLVVGSYRIIDNTYQSGEHNTDHTWVVRVQGCTDFSTVGYSGTWIDLGMSAESKPDIDGKGVPFEATSFTLRGVNAIRVLWDYMPGWKAGTNSYWAPLHDIEINGSTHKYTFCQLTDDVTKIGNPAYLYAPESYEKLRGGILATDGVGGCQRVKHISIGASTDAAALSLARTHLTVSLRMSSMRRYEYRGVCPGTPELGITVVADENGDGSADYTGILRDYSFSIQENGITTATGTLLDSSAEVIE